MKRTLVQIVSLFGWSAGLFAVGLWVVYGPGPVVKAAAEFAAGCCAYRAILGAIPPLVRVAWRSRVLRGSEYDAAMEHVERPMSYDAGELLLAAMSPAVVDIRVGDVENIRVSVAGLAGLCDRVGAELDGGTLRISGTGHPSQAPGAHGRTRLARIRWRMYQIGVMRERAQVVVELPAGMPIAIADDSPARYTIGDTEGPLELRLGGLATASAGRVGRASVTVTELGYVRIKRVEGESLRTLIMGTGRLWVDDGRVDELRVQATSAGSAGFEGVAGQAALFATGCGTVHVHRVTGAATATVDGHGLVGADAVHGPSLIAVVSGLGGLSVDDGQVAELNIASASAGRVVFRGVAADATLSATGSGDVEVTAVTGSLVEIEGSDGRVIVKHRPAERPES